MDSLWQLPVIDGPVPWIVYAIAVALALILLIRPYTPRRLLRAVVAVAIGAAVGVGAYLVANATNAFGDALPRDVALWAGGTCAAIGLAVASLWDSPVWRKIVAVFAIIWFVITGVIGVNALYGLNPTLGSVFGIVSGDPIVLPTPAPTKTEASGPLYQSWKPPADMPAKGTVGTQVIPSTGFEARPAGLYLPPAALVKDAPALPLVIFMMGYPGNPDPSYIAAALDEYAAKNNGLAPIAIVADQIGSGGDPACADSTAYGAAETYITKDVVAWAKANLHVIDDPKAWVIGGYSNGGGCAIKYAAKYPEQWRNIIDVSGEQFPGSEDPDAVTATIYGGDAAAFEASKPINIMAAAPPGTYAGMNLALTAGAQDPTYIGEAKAIQAAAEGVGMNVTYYEVPGAGHVGDALSVGLSEAIGVMYPILGLSAP